MPEPHKTTVTPVRRRTHDIERIVLFVRCNGCHMRFECTDEERAQREALRHESSQAQESVAGGVDHA